MRKEQTMDEQKQIEELSEFFYRVDRTTYRGGPIRVANYDALARALYDAGYRKQSENVVELPCKVGQTVWVIVGGMLPYIAECEVIAVCHQFRNLDDRREIYIFSVVARNSRTPDNFFETDIGKRVFLTKEEAEQDIAKMRGGE